MTRYSSKALSLILCLAVCLVSCTPKYTYQMPEQTNDGWETASLSNAGISEKPLRALVEAIHRDKYRNIHSILIARKGDLVFEEYFGGYRYNYQGEQFRGEFVNYDANTTHDIASITKAITSALVGIAIDHSQIQDVNQKVFSFFPEYSHLKDQKKDKITVEHLLTMTSGLQWNEMDVSVNTRNEKNDIIQSFHAADPIEYILAKPVVAEPGTRWYYSGGDVNILGEVIRKATGLRMDDFAQQHLFTPLGIKEYKWDFMNPDIIHAAANLKLRPRDMLKFGQMYLDGGMWKGKRILSRQWVERSTKAQQRVSPESWQESEGERYGYQWFLRTYHTRSGAYESYLRTGWGGQRIVVLPGLEMVVVFTGGNHATPDPENEIMIRYILPAVR